MSKRSLIQRRDSYSLCVLGIWNKFYSWVRNLNIYVQVILIFAVSRILGWALFTIVGKQETYSPWSQRPMSYFNFVNIWDADWYRKIAESGYPSQLPVDQAGTVAENPWAFYPLYPLINSWLVKLTGGSYESLAALVSLLSGFVAVVLMYRVFEASLGSWERLNSRKTALWGIAVFSFAPLAPVLQVAYAEALNLVFLLVVLWCLMRERFGWAVLLAVPTALSRPVGVPLGATAGILWFLAMLGDARQEGSISLSVLSKRLPQLISALLICAAAFIWPAIAWMKTGRVDAYTATETAWRGTDLYLVMPWVDQSLRYFGFFGPILLAGLILFFIIVLSSRAARSTLHPVLICWSSSYAAYLILFLNPQSSLFRMLLPLFPLALLAVVLSQDRAYRILLLLAGSFLQFSWVGWLWHWKQLPSGGDYPP